VDEQYRFVNCYDEFMDDLLIAKKYVDEYLDAKDLYARSSLSDWLKRGGKIASTAQLANSNFYKSDFYHEILVPLGYRHSIYVALKTAMRPIGVLALHRNDIDEQFSLIERRYLNEIGKRVSFALRIRSLHVDMISGESEAEVVVFDDIDRLLHYTPQGRRLLFLAFNPEVKKGALKQRDLSLQLPDQFHNFVKNFRERSGVKSLDISSDKWIIRNIWGTFVFKPNWLLMPGKEFVDRRVFMTIQRQEPLLYRVMQKCDALDLTERQTEVVIWLFRGASHEVMAKSMNVSAHTVSDHVKRVYEKFGVNSRSELYLKLLSFNVMNHDANKYNDYAT
jgi:DNA-binding CsgD family transcriptional regulator